MNAQDISYALAKQVHDMARGFAIHTNYGDITIPPGWMAERIAQHVRRVLQCEQLAQPDIVLPIRIEQGLDAAAKWLDDRATGKVTPDGYDTHGFKPGAGVIGAGYVPPPAAVLIHDSVGASHSASQARLQGVRAQIASLRQRQPMPECADRWPASATAHTPGCADDVPAPHTHCSALCAPCEGLQSQPPAPQSQPAQWGELS